MLIRFLALWSLFTSAAVASGQLEFSAYLRVGDKELFILASPVTGRSSDWITVGESFGGYSIGKYDPKFETLTVTGGGETFTLQFNSSKLQDTIARGEQASALTTRLEMATGVLTTMRKRYRNAHPTIKTQLREIAKLERQLSEQNGKR